MAINDNFKIAFAGDIMIGGEYIKHVKSRQLDILQPFQQFAECISDVDIVIINLEGPIFEGPNKRNDKTSILSNHPAICDIFKDKIVVFIAANNHIMDYGVEGLQHTLQLLRSKNIYYVGAGNNYAEANRELTVVHKGTRIAFLACTSNEPYIGGILAENEYPGCASYLETARLVKRIKHIRDKHDFICISLHWGFEHYNYPNHEQLKIAHALADAGADFIFGHHPHVIQGYEKYNATLIFYSLGNLFLPPVCTVSGRLQIRKKSSKEFMLIKAELNQSAIFGIEIIGGNVTKNYNLVPYDKKKQAEFNSTLNKLSDRFKTQGFEHFWNIYDARRRKELTRESIIEAFMKLLNISPMELIKSLTINDFRRNIERLFKLVSKSL